MESKFNLFFDTEQINNLTFELKGRPELDKSKCKVHLVGQFFVPKNALANGKTKVKKLIHHNFHEEKVKRLLKELDPESAPWKIQMMERNKKAREKQKEEENANIEDHTEPRQFVKKGVEIFNILVGHGRRAQIGDRVTIAYKGRLNPDASKCFDKTSLRHPFTFRLGSKKMIKGINIGVEGMTLHGKRELIIPPNRAFGTQGIEGKVPPNATVYYDVELVDLIPKKTAEAQRVKEQQQRQREENIKKRKNYAGITKLTKEFVTLDDNNNKKKKKS
jgi:FKBP-type peptidyl-prolyl cis-trans isomerase